MKDALIKNIHVFIILYTGWNLYEIYEEKELVINSIITRTQSSESKLIRSKKSLAEIDRFNKNLEESKKRVKGVVENITKIQRQLPSEIRDTEVQSILGEITTALKIQSPDTKPKQEESKGFYFSKEYIFDAKGTFLQLLIFFEKLENLSKVGRILNVKYARFTVNADADKRSRFKVLDLSTTVESYRYNPNYKIQGSVQ